MPRERKALDANDLIRRYKSGTTVKQLASDSGVGKDTIVSRMRAAGYSTLRHSPPVDLDVPALVAAYHTGSTISELQKLFGVGKHVVVTRLASAGIMARQRPAPRLKTNDAAIVATYESGLSIAATAKACGISAMVVQTRLREASIPLRDKATAQHLSASRFTPEQRKARSAAALTAWRGQKQPFEARASAAKARESSILAAPFTTQIGRGEKELSALLIARGYVLKPQHAVGPFNCDLAHLPADDGTAPVAVEIIGRGKLQRARTPRALERLKYILNAGFRVLIIATRGPQRITDLTADHVVSHLQQTSSDVTARGSYRMIDCDGQLLATGRVQDGQLPFMPPLPNGPYRSSTDANPTR